MPDNGLRTDGCVVAIEHFSNVRRDISRLRLNLIKRRTTESIQSSSSERNSITDLIEGKHMGIVDNFISNIVDNKLFFVKPI